MSTPISAVAVISKVSLGNGAIAVTLQTNSDPTSNYVATLYVQPTQTATDIQNWVDARKADAAAQYDAMQAAHTALAGIS